MGTSTGGAEMRINLNKLPSQQEVVKQINKDEAVRPDHPRWPANCTRTDTN